MTSTHTIPLFYLFSEKKKPNIFCVQYFPKNNEILIFLLWGTKKKKICENNNNWSAVCSWILCTLMSQHTWVGKPAKARKRTRFAGGHLTLIVVFFYSLFFSHIRAANSPRAVLLVAANSHCWPGEGVNNNISPLMHVDSCQLPRFTCRRGASTRADNMRGGSGDPFSHPAALCAGNLSLTCAGIRAWSLAGIPLTKRFCCFRCGTCWFFSPQEGCEAPLWCQNGSRWHRTTCGSLCTHWRCSVGKPARGSCCCHYTNLFPFDWDACMEEVFPEFAHQTRRTGIFAAVWGGECGNKLNPLPTQEYA